MGFTQPFIGNGLLFFGLYLMAFLGNIPDSITKYGPEICDNAIDDDGDGQIDLNDGDCICQIIIPRSLIPNPSFESYTCCPSASSQLGCVLDWIQASEATTDYINTCGYGGFPEFPPPRPFPDGQGIVGFRDGYIRADNDVNPFWKEYTGACLLSPLIAGETYVFEFYLGFVTSLLSPPINICFFGTSDCKYLPFGEGNPRFGCPTNDSNWVKLTSKFIIGGLNLWEKVSVEITPNQNITAIAIGPDCPAVISNNSIYYYLDNLLLDELESFQFKIEATEKVCFDNILLKVPKKAKVNYQWYKDGIALLGEKSEIISKMYGEGKYEVRISDNNSCKITEPYEHKKPVISVTTNKIICKDTKFTFGNNTLSSSGTYTHVFKNSDNCDSLVTLNLKVLGDISDTLQAKIFEGETYKIGSYKFSQSGKHIAILKSSLGCDSIVLIELSFINIFFPNIFTPNSDGNNDIFTMYDPENLMESFELNIYDRWGSLVYKGLEWDGALRGKDVLPGIYTYIAKVKPKNGSSKLLNGSITLIR